MCRSKKAPACNPGGYLGFTILRSRLKAPPPTLRLSWMSETKNLRSFAAHDWDHQKENIARLYAEENRTLAEVMSIIENRYGLRATCVTSHSSGSSLPLAGTNA